MTEQNTTVNSELSMLPNTDSNGRRFEIWPAFECQACGHDGDIVTWEESSYTSEMDSSVQSYDGVEPCCSKCGTRVLPELVESWRQDQWRQPIYYVVSGISGLGYSHPAVKNIMREYHSDPESFLSASVEELMQIEGVGVTFADKIHTRRAVAYPEFTPEVDGVLYEFRGRRIRDIEPSRLARDLAIGYVGPDDLPSNVSDDDTSVVIREAAQILRDKKDQLFWSGDKSPDQMEALADDLGVVA